MRIYADETPAMIAETIYCYGQERENTSSVAERAACFFNEGRVASVAIPTYGNLTKYNWYFGFIRRILLHRGVPEEKIVSIPHLEEFSIAHTRTEAIGLARYARTAGWKTIYITALPSHLLRAFAETVDAILKEYPELAAYNAVGAVLPWTESTIHSQGVVNGTRYAVIESELKKILAYHLKGDLAVTARGILDYLNRRTQ